MIEQRSIEDLKTYRNHLNTELDEGIRDNNFNRIEQMLADLERIDNEINFRQIPDGF